MKKTNIFNNIITNFSPAIEELIRNICNDLDNKDKIDEMLEKYLYDKISPDLKLEYSSLEPFSLDIKRNFLFVVFVSILNLFT